MENIFLTGFMATGKTVVGAALARRLGRRFVDLDTEIERISGMTVAEIFSRLGEPEFRARERAALARACALDSAVIATGGGAVVDPASRAAMRACGRIVCLTAAPEAILARLGPAHDRPLLADEGSRERKVRALLAERQPAYRDHDLAVDTSAADPEAIVESIVAWLGDPRTGGARSAGRRGGAPAAKVGAE